jgi:hypothetical protein
VLTIVASMAKRKITSITPVTAIACFEALGEERASRVGAA